MQADDPITDAVAQRLPPLLARHTGLVALFDPADRLYWANAGFRAAYGLPAGLCPTWTEIVRMSHARRVGAAIVTDDFERWLASAASRRGKLRYRQFEADLHDGRWILMTETVDDDGWMLCLALDVSDLGRDHRALRTARDLAVRASQVDSLTGLANRAAILEGLDDALAADPGTVCVAVIDLDHFKRINDDHGHAAGDAVLRDFAGLLQRDLRTADRCGRIGGEEFLLVLRDTDLSRARSAVLRLLAGVRQSRPLPSKPAFGYTASAGLAMAMPGERPAEVIRRADTALYEAKGAGRDRCAVAVTD